MPMTEICYLQKEYSRNTMPGLFPCRPKILRKHIPTLCGLTNQHLNTSLVPLRTPSTESSSLWTDIGLPCR